MQKLTGASPHRYVTLAVIVIVAGVIYPLIYLRQNFEVSMLESFGITSPQLLQLYVMLGILYMVTYLPSGWLADRIAPRILMSFSLAFAGLLGLWFSTMPSYGALKIIFAGWGIAAGLTFWSAHIKATTLLAKPSEQGRFFGILDGGRGLVEALLATIAVAMLSYFTTEVGQDTPTALRKVIYLYVFCMLALAPVAYFFVPQSTDQQNPNNEASDVGRHFFTDLKVVVSKPEIWLCAICILTGYQLFWATYSFSVYMQSYYGLTAVTVGAITTAKLWMRPLGAVSAGFIGDFSDREAVLALLLVLSSIALASLTKLSTGAGTAALLAIVLAIGFLTYAVRGVFWATLESCDVSNKIKGLAIGAISLLGYSPDIYLPLINSYLLDTYPGKQAYDIYFLGISAFGIVGACSAWRLKVLISRRQK